MEIGRQNCECAHARRKYGAVPGTIKTKPLRGGLPARLDSPCARRLPGKQAGAKKRPFKPNKETGSFQQDGPDSDFLLASVAAIKRSFLLEIRLTD